MSQPKLGWIAPPDRAHEDKYPLRKLAAPPVVCERRISFKSLWRKFYNQGQTPECVAFSSSEERSLATRGTFDPNWLYARCKERDGMPNQDGTLLRVAYDVLRELGPKPVHASGPDLSKGVARNEWASSVDDIRVAIQNGASGVVMGSNWYDAMFDPIRRGGHYWLPASDANLGSLAGGHAYLLDGVSDHLEAFTTPNSWGESDRSWHPGEAGWPVTLIPYSLIERLLAEDGECCVPVLKTV